MIGAAVTRPPTGGLFISTGRDRAGALARPFDFRQESEKIKMPSRTPWRHLYFLNIGTY